MFSSSMICILLIHVFVTKSLCISWVSRLWNGSSFVNYFNRLFFLERNFSIKSYRCIVHCFPKVVAVFGSKIFLSWLKPHQFFISKKTCSIPLCFLISVINFCFFSSSETNVFKILASRKQCVQFSPESCVCSVFSFSNGKCKRMANWRKCWMQCRRCKTNQMSIKKTISLRCWSLTSIVTFTTKF